MIEDSSFCPRLCGGDPRSWPAAGVGELPQTPQNDLRIIGAMHRRLMI